MLAVEGAPDRGGTVIGPDDLIQQAVGSEQFIQQYARVSVRVPVQVQVQGPVRGQQAVHQRQALVQEIQVSFQVRPVITVPLSQLPLLGFARIFSTTDTR